MKNTLFNSLQPSSATIMLYQGLHNLQVFEKIIFSIKFLFIIVMEYESNQYSEKRIHSQKYLWR